MWYIYRKISNHKRVSEINFFTKLFPMLFGSQCPSQIIINNNWSDNNPNEKILGSNDSPLNNCTLYTDIKKNTDNTIMICSDVHDI